MAGSVYDFFDKVSNSHIDGRNELSEERKKKEMTEWQRKELERRKERKKKCAWTSKILFAPYRDYKLFLRK